MVKEFLRKEIVRHFVSDLILSIMVTDNDAFNLLNIASNAVGGAITSSIKKRYKEDSSAANSPSHHHHNLILLVICHLDEDEA